MKNLSKFELHIFDLDDTLINTRYSYKTAQKTALEKILDNLKGKEFLSALTTLRWLCEAFGSGQTKQYFKAFLVSQSTPENKAAELLKKLLEVYYFVFWSELKPFQGAVDFLDALAERGDPLALASNGTAASQEKKLANTGLKKFFKDESSFISGNFPSDFKKPSPHMLRLACDKAGVSPDKAIFYGNTAGDILAGNLAGTAVAFYGDLFSLPAGLPSVATPDMNFKNWSEAARKFEPR